MILRTDPPPWPPVALYCGLLFKTAQGIYIHIGKPSEEIMFPGSDAEEKAMSDS